MKTDGSVGHRHAVVINDLRSDGIVSRGQIGESGAVRECSVSEKEIRGKHIRPAEKLHSRDRAIDILYL